MTMEVGDNFRSDSGGEQQGAARVLQALPDEERDVSREKE